VLKTIAQGEARYRSELKKLKKHIDGIRKICSETNGTLFAPGNQIRVLAKHSTMLEGMELALGITARERKKIYREIGLTEVAIRRQEEISV
jgi:hypothetical protein